MNCFTEFKIGDHKRKPENFKPNFSKLVIRYLLLHRCILYRIIGSLTTFNIIWFTYNFSGTLNNIKWENAHGVIVGGNDTWEVAVF